MIKATLGRDLGREPKIIFLLYLSLGLQNFMKRIRGSDPSFLQKSVYNEEGRLSRVKENLQVEANMCPSKNSDRLDFPSNR